MIPGGEEIGRELNVRELTADTVVFVLPPSCSAYVSLWIKHVGETTIAFHSAVLKMTIINLILPDGRIVDFRGRQVRVFEYLGKV
jgi:hypothetical protein